jgi:nucleoside-diphosphate-sugar epimerase
MRILVLGGTGFIGSQVVKVLIQNGHDVAILHRGETSTLIPPYIFAIRGERGRLEKSLPMFRNFRPQTVIDILAYTEQDAKELMSVFGGLAERVVVLSSQDVYRAFAIVWKLEEGELQSVPFNEDAKLRADLYPYRHLATNEDDFKYYYGKIPVERIVMSNPQLPGTVLRLPCVYGIGDHKHRVFEYLKRMDDRREFILLDDRRANWRWTRGYVEDIAKAIVLAATNELAINRIYNIGEARALTELQWIEAIGRVAGWHGEVITVRPNQLPPNMVGDFNYQQDLYADISRIQMELGFMESMTLEESLRRTIEWERANPPAYFEPSEFDYLKEGEVLRKVRGM